jgi:hypothetical protein
MFLFSPIHATCPTHLFLSYFIILILLGKEYTLWSPLLCSFFALPSPQLSLIHIFSAPSVYIPPLTMRETKFQTHINHRKNYSIEYSNFYIFWKQVGRLKLLECTHLFLDQPPYQHRLEFVIFFIESTLPPSRFTLSAYPRSWQAPI